jgi:hypothetical protein
MRDNENDWRNRNRIKTPNGPLWLTVPVEVKGKYLQAIRTRVSDPMEPAPLTIDPGRYARALYRPEGDPRRAVSGLHLRVAERDQPGVHLALRAGRSRRASPGRWTIRCGRAHRARRPVPAGRRHRLPVGPAARVYRSSAVRRRRHRAELRIPAIRNTSSCIHRSITT